MTNKNFDKLMNDINETINKLEEDGTTLEQSIPLFEKGLVDIKEASERLNEIKTKIKKVLEDNKTEEI